MVSHPQKQQDASVVKVVTCCDFTVVSFKHAKPAMHV